MNLLSSGSLYHMPTTAGAGPGQNEEHGTQDLSLKVAETQVLKP